MLQRTPQALLRPSIGPQQALYRHSIRALSAPYMHALYALHTHFVPTLYSLYSNTHSIPLQENAARLAAAFFLDAWRREDQTDGGSRSVTLDLDARWSAVVFIQARGSIGNDLFKTLPGTRMARRDFSTRDAPK